jgi:hypothetical protein
LKQSKRGRGKISRARAAKEGLLPLVVQIGETSQRIRTFDAAVVRMSKRKYPDTERLQQVGGVGPITSLTYILKLGTKNRLIDLASVLSG